MKVLPPLCLMLFISLFSTSALCCMTKEDLAEYVSLYTRGLPADSERAKYFKDLFYQSNKIQCQNQPTHNPKKQAPAPTDVINIGTVEGSFYGVDSITGRYSVETVLTTNPRLYCDMSYINLNPKASMNIPNKFINDEGIKMSTQVRLQNVTKKGKKCYFESITVLKPKIDRRITLENVKTTRNYFNIGDSISIERNNPTLVKEMPRCQQGQFRRRLKGNKQYPLIPKIPKGSIITIVVSLQGSQCAYEKIEVIKLAKKG